MTLAGGKQAPTRAWSRSSVVELASTEQVEDKATYSWPLSILLGLCTGAMHPPLGRSVRLTEVLSHFASRRKTHGLPHIPRLLGGELDQHHCENRYYLGKRLFTPSRRCRRWEARRAGPGRPRFGIVVATATWHLHANPSLYSSPVGGGRLELPLSIFSSELSARGGPRRVRDRHAARPCPLVVIKPS